MIEFDKIINYLILLGTDPLTVALAILIATFILEDAATVAAAMLASDGVLPVYLAIMALISGIVLGDVGLYGLGRLSTKSPWVLAGGVVLAIIGVSRVYRHALSTSRPSEGKMPNSNTKPQAKVYQDCDESDLDRPKIVAGIPGMPPINLNQPPLSFYEFWPPRLLYIPIALTWGVLALRYLSITLPTVAKRIYPLTE